MIVIQYLTVIVFGAWIVYLTIGLIHSIFTNTNTTSRYDNGRQFSGRR